MTAWEAILQAVMAQRRRPWLDDLMLLASALGGGGFIWIIFGTIAGIFPAHTEGHVAALARRSRSRSSWSTMC